MATTSTPASAGAGSGGIDTRAFVYAPDGRVIGEYGTSAADVKAEFIWMSPEVGDAGMFGGDDGLGGYMPLAVATPDPVSGGSQLSWVHGNHMGVPAVFTNASGTQVPFPTGYSAPGFPGQSRTFADLYYNRYRDYDTSTGRYIQADPIGLAGGPSPYSYAMNNPLRYTDPTGEIVPLLVIGFLIWFDIDLIQQRVNGKRAWSWKNEYCEDQDINFGEAAVEGLVGAIPTAKVIKWVKYGREFRIGKGRAAPFGNRNPDKPDYVPHPTGKYPHYHRPRIGPDGKPLPGQGAGRHRPWDRKPQDTSFWDRF